LGSEPPRTAAGRAASGRGALSSLAVCGRYTLTAAPARVAESFGVAAPAELRPRYNVAPGQAAPAVLAGPSGARELRFLRWGLVPPWADGPGAGARASNARIESAAERPTFRAAFRQRRCLVPADGFYEWRARAGGAEPHHVALPGGALFAFAGLHERFEEPGGATLLTFTILTGPARGRLRELHGRMPLIVAPEDYDAWIDPAPGEPEALRALLGSRLSDALEFRPVDGSVNDARFDGPACLAPASQLSLL
jgi:putative SOS response-associated peptidase YedK